MKKEQNINKLIFRSYLNLYSKPLVNQFDQHSTRYTWFQSILENDYDKEK